MSKFRRLMFQKLILILGIIAEIGGNDFDPTFRFDGWYNNLAHADWGTSGRALSRNVEKKYAEAHYMDDAEVPKPNPRELSEVAMSGPEGIVSPGGHSLLHVFFGQHLVDEIVDTRRVACPNGFMNVKMSSDDRDILPFYRSKFAASPGTATPFPTIPINEATSWIDGSAIYGGSVSWADHLREFKAGRLLTEPGTNLPTFNRNGLGLINPTIDTKMHPSTRNPKELLNFGNPRGNENAFLMVVGILFFRYHNYNAQILLQQHPDWTDEKLYETARKWTIAVYQNIAMYQWLPYMTGINVPSYQGYNKFLEPGISAEFSSAAMRIGHSMVPPGSVLRTANCSVVSPLPEYFGPDAGEPGLRLCNTYWQLQDALLKHGIDDIVRGMASQPAEKIDHVIDTHLRNFLYGPVKRPRMDIETMTIQRGRDTGLPMYNSARKAFGLPMIKDFSDFKNVLDEQSMDKLRDMYNNNTDYLELYVGGMLESDNGKMGDLFAQIIQQQFIRLRDSDRFWFENTDNGFFNESDIVKIKNTTLYDIIVSTTNILPSELQKNVFNATESACIPVLFQNLTFNKECTPNRSVDLFHGYAGKFSILIVLLLLFPVVSYFIMLMIARKHQDTTREKQGLLRKAVGSLKNKPPLPELPNVVSAIEIQGKQKTQKVLVRLIETCILINNENKKVLRKICISNFKKVYLLLSRNKKKNVLVVRVPHEYDVVLRFNSFEERSVAHQKFDNFFKTNEVVMEVFDMDETALLIEAVTKEARQLLLESFFLKVFAEVLELKGESPKKKKTRFHFNFGRKNDHSIDLVDCVLSINELAEMLGMTPESLFVQQMFSRADKDNNGYLSMREFVDLIILLMDGSPEQKVKLLFEMYDTDKSGCIERQEGEDMIRSFLELSGQTNDIDIELAVSAVFNQAEGDNKSCLTLEDFTKVMLKDHREAFESAGLTMTGKVEKVRKKSLANLTKPQAHKDKAVNTSGIVRHRKKSVMDKKGGDKPNSIYSEASALVEEKNGWKKFLQSTKRLVENYRRHIFCMVLFYGVTIGLMIERAEHYAWHSEHTGIRRVTEIGIIMSRSTAAAISFHYSFILLTMCRNIITILRETFLNSYIPFDSAIEFHRHIAYVAIIETAIHVLGHVINVYHFSVHPLPVLACLFPKVFLDDGSDMPKSFVWWAFQNLTGLTGVLLVLVLAIMYVFSMQYARRYCFRAFWWTHNLFVILFVLTILHGSVGLIQPPLFHVYLAVPGAIYLIDKFIMLSRSKVEITVVNAQPMPSDVLNLVFKRPEVFDYRSGQWVRIACPCLGSNEYHPFTLTSAPHEEYLSLHIRSVGPWTTNLRQLYKNALETNSVFPKIYLDGPFGEGHQDWYKYDVSVLVGAGIGVTPFASILKDIVKKSKNSYGMRMTCKKVYFIWVTRTQRHFEWLTDIIKEVESSDINNLVDVHIYITQFHQKFDLRTTMLYICERYFQKIANTSLFTGLKSVTHFGRPQFEQFLDSIQYSHIEAERIGVFSCGPPGLTKGVEAACRNLNKMDKAQFIHYFENF